MSFSLQIKEELTDHRTSARHCQIAELAAIISSCGCFSVRQDRRLFLVLQSENRLVIRRAEKLIRRAFHVVSQVSVLGNGDWKKGRLYTLAILDNEAVNRILKSVKYLSETGVLRELDLPVNGLLLNHACCRRAFLRGAFLSTGSVSDPHKSYHFEVVCANREKAEQIQEVIGTFDIEAKIVLRKKSYVVYVKEGDSISALFSVMEAPQGMMELENIRILREISGSVNRSVNCETANLNKTVSAAVEQVRDIERIRDTIGLESLPEPLYQMAMVRLEHQDAPLKDLGQYLDPPVGKSGVNHRLRKLKSIADELTPSESEETE
ncbi:MAG: DNA-binding protein WhiA [Clostridiales bacterium]|nr:DNA-binding protein WhiA [Clostridiales bacterium]